MPREVKTNVDTREVLTPISRPRSTEVVARPTDQFVQPALDPELQGLVNGLAPLSQSLQQYAYASRFEQARENQKQREAGAAARSQGKEIDPNSPEAFRHGYMEHDGHVKGDLDGQLLRSKYLTEFDKDTGDIEGFVRDHFAENMKGVTDQSFLGGYNQTLTKHIEAVRDAHLKYQQEAIVEKTESNALYKLDKSIRAYVENGEDIPDVVIDSQRKDLKRLGVTGSRFNELLWASIKVIGDEGNFAIYDTLKKPRPDGTPGMYFIPGMKEKIDAAQIHSQNVYLQKRNQAETAAKKEREDKQDQALFNVFLKADTDPEGARQDYINLRSSGLFSNASELVEWDAKFNTAANREASGIQLNREVDIQQGIYTGRVRPADIMRADLRPAQKRSLMGEWYRVKNDNRQAAAAEQKGEDSIFKTQSFKEMDEYLETNLKPTQSMLDFNKEEYEYGLGQLAMARLELNDLARTAKTPKELRDGAYAIVTDYSKRAKEAKERGVASSAKRIRFPTPQALKEARTQGRISREELALHIEYFKSQQRNP